VWVDAAVGGGLSRPGGLIYIDAFKSDEDLSVAAELFPSAILCGDDWTWRDEDGRLRMRGHVQQFAAAHQREIAADGATLLLGPE
jgi:hypothetical protein